MNAELAQELVQIVGAFILLAVPLQVVVLLELVLLLTL